jgi:hypothetical protein
LLQTDVFLCPSQADMFSNLLVPLT